MTSLLSGTALKSVIAYVADYITKTPLKTHVMFQSVQNVFERNEELLGGQKNKKEKARSLITKMVNALTAASEIGGPMASMYLLKHPDHYTSHKFRVFYWRSFVTEVMQAWTDSGDIADPVKSTVILGLKDNSRGKVVALSPVIDYIWRPVELEQVSLYDWIRTHSKRHIPCNKQPKGRYQPLQVEEGDSEFEDNYDVQEQPVGCSVVNDAAEANLDLQEELPKMSGGRMSVPQEEEESDDELLLTTESNANLIKESVKVEVTKRIASKSPPGYARFHPNHPQSHTHEVMLVDEKDAYVPNLIGGPLPRKDAGSREEYCMTMLTLFKPWRSGNDLRPHSDALWNDVFEAHPFTERQQQLMKFFHIKYECNDARDDFSAKRKQVENGVNAPFYMSNKDIDELDVQGVIYDNISHQENREEDIVNASNWNAVSEAEVLRQTRFAQAEHIMRSSGWMDSLADAKASADNSTLHHRLNVDEEITATEWKQTLEKQRQAILEARESQAENKKKAGVLPVNQEVDSVKLIDKDYFMRKAFRAKDAEAQKMIDDTVTTFSLNEAQERAFRIVANHAVESCGEHLKMYHRHRKIPSNQGFDSFFL